MTLVITPIKAESQIQLTMNLEGNKTSINEGEELVYIIKSSATVVACNFNIVYDKNVIQFVGSATNGLSAAVNEDVVSCIYADISNTGTNEFKIKFKAIKTTNETRNFNNKC